MASMGGPGLRGGAARVLVVEAVDDEVGVVGARAVDGEVRAAGALGLLADAGHQVGEVGEVAAVQRHLHHLAADDHVALHGALRVEQGRRGGHLHGLRNGADLQHDVEPRGLVDLERDAALVQAAEAFFFDDQPVVAGRQVGHRVFPALIRFHFAELAGGGMAHLDRGIRNNGSGWVFYDADDVGGGALREQRGAERRARGMTTRNDIRGLPWLRISVSNGYRGVKPPLSVRSTA